MTRNVWPQNSGRWVLVSKRVLVEQVSRCIWVTLFWPICQWGLEPCVNGSFWIWEELLRLISIKRNWNRSTFSLLVFAFNGHPRAALEIGSLFLWQRLSWTTFARGKWLWLHGIFSAEAEKITPEYVVWRSTGGEGSVWRSQLHST